MACLDFPRRAFLLAEPFDWALRARIGHGDSETAVHYRCFRWAEAFELKVRRLVRSHSLSAVSDQASTNGRMRTHRG